MAPRDAPREVPVVFQWKTVSIGEVEGSDGEEGNENELQISDDEELEYEAEEQEEEREEAVEIEEDEVWNHMDSFM